MTAVRTPQLSAMRSVIIVHKKSKQNIIFDSLLVLVSLGSLAGLMYWMVKQSQNLQHASSLSTKSQVVSTKQYPLNDRCGTPEFRKQMDRKLKRLKKYADIVNQEKPLKPNSNRPDCRVLFRMEGVLLHGEKGTGKTFAAHAVAAKSGYPMVYIHGSRVTGTAYVGAPEEYIHQMTDVVIESAKVSGAAVLIVDEVEALIRSRQRRSGHSDMMNHYYQREDGCCRAMLALLDRCHDLNVLVIAITNLSPKDFDPSIKRPNRLGELCEFKNRYRVNFKDRHILFEKDLTSLCKELAITTSCLSQQYIKQVSESLSKIANQQGKSVTIAHLRGYLVTIGGDFLVWKESDSNTRVKWDSLWQTITDRWFATHCFDA